MVPYRHAVSFAAYNATACPNSTLMVINLKVPITDARLLVDNEDTGLMTMYFFSQFTDASAILPTSVNRQRLHQKQKQQQQKNLHT